MNPSFMFFFWAKLNMKVQWPIPAYTRVAYQGNWLECLGFELLHDSKQNVITGHIFGQKLKSGSWWETVVYAVWWSMAFNSSPGRIWKSMGGLWHIKENIPGTSGNTSQTKKKQSFFCPYVRDLILAPLYNPFSLSFYLPFHGNVRDWAHDCDMM